jgi:thiol-disulfide isomerase/thioredoxin
VLALGRARPRFIKEIGPDFATKRSAAFVVDEPAKAAWEGRLASLQQAMAAATDVPLAVREEQDWLAFMADFRAAERMQPGQPVDAAPFRARFDAHVAKYAALDKTLLLRARGFIGAVARRTPGFAAAEWVRIEAESPSGALRLHAGDERRLLGTMGRPLQIAFTAVDGRPVDLAQLRGKVVLVDFWATWCGPCIGEIPNIKKVYQAYHDQGFEVIGIALENAGFSPQDTAAQTAAKLAAAKKVLTDFTTARDMPWPQHTDGKWWKNELSSQYKISAVPAMFLIDQAGRVVSTNARGPALEAEVKRLLKL